MGTANEITDYPDKYPRGEKTFLKITRGGAVFYRDEKNDTYYKPTKPDENGEFRLSMISVGDVLREQEKTAADETIVSTKRLVMMVVHILGANVMYYLDPKDGAVYPLYSGTYTPMPDPIFSFHQSIEEGEQTQPSSIQVYPNAVSTWGFSSGKPPILLS